MRGVPVPYVKALICGGARAFDVPIPVVTEHIVRADATRRSDCMWQIGAYVRAMRFVHRTHPLTAMSGDWIDPGCVRPGHIGADLDVRPESDQHHRHTSFARPRRLPFGRYGVFCCDVAAAVARSVTLS